MKLSDMQNVYEEIVSSSGRSSSRSKILSSSSSSSSHKIPAISIEDMRKLPIYFNIDMPRSTHMTTIIKIDTDYYSFGYGFADTISTSNPIADRLSIWDREGTIVSPDNLFRLNTNEEMRLVDFGILCASHIENIETKYLNNIGNIYSDYTMQINLKPDNTLDDINTEGAIILKNLQFTTNDSRYFSSGQKPLVKDKSNNCVTFTNSIFTNRMVCLCPLSKRFTNIIDNHPDNCKTIKPKKMNHVYKNRCQLLYTLLNTHINPYSIVYILYISCKNKILCNLTRDKCAESNIYILTYSVILRNARMTPGVA